MTFLLLKLRRLAWEGGVADGAPPTPARRAAGPVVASFPLPGAAAGAGVRDERWVAALLRPRTGLVEVQPRG